MSMYTLGEKLDTKDIKERPVEQNNKGLLRPYLNRQKKFFFLNYHTSSAYLKNADGETVKDILRPQYATGLSSTIFKKDLGC